MRATRADGGSHKKLAAFRLVAPSVKPSVCQLPGRGAFWCGTNSNIKPALKGDSSRARPVGDAARGESGGIGSIASGSAARRPYSNQRCGFRVAKAGGAIKRLIALCLSQPLSLTSFDSSPAGEPFGHIIFYSPALGSSSLGPLPR